MKNINFMFLLLFVLPSLAFCQETTELSRVKTKTGEIKIPGNWQQLNTADDTGQIYLQNNDGVTIAVAQNPKKAYPFFKSNKSDFDNVKLFYIWDSDYRKENKFKTEKLKEHSKLEYIIWKYSEDKIDNVFLFGSAKDNFINLLVYTNS